MRSKMKRARTDIRDLNFRLVIYALILSIIGIMVVHSATANEVSNSLVNATVKQIIGVAGGIILMVILASVDYRKLIGYFWIFYLAAVLALLYVKFVASPIYGANRWIYIPMLGTIQPSEFAKPVLLITLAFIVKKLDGKISKLLGLLIYFAAAAPIVVLVLIEPDLSTTIVLGVLIVSVLFVGGISYKWVGAVIALMIPLIVFLLIAVYQPGQEILYKILEPHQVERINAYFFPNDYPALVYQQHNSVMAIGSGGLFGKGLNNTSLESVKNGNFLSEESSDFIFAVVGEELGFVGSVLIIALLTAVTIECLITAGRCQDIAGKVIAAGAGCGIGVQGLINIGVATLIIPNTGIPLPFVSAGLSSLLSTYIMLGLVLSISIRGRTKKRVYY